MKIHEGLFRNVHGFYTLSWEVLCSRQGQLLENTCFTGLSSGSVKPAKGEQLGPLEHNTGTVRADEDGITVS